MEKKTLGLISLGCDKNRTDSEKLLGLIKDDFIITQDISKAQILVINTCAFLESSRKESIETVLDCNMWRQNGKLEKIIMTGCLPQRFIDEFYDEFVEVDGFLGTYDYDRFKETVMRCYDGERVNNVGKGGNNFKNSDCPRIVTTPPHYAYLKIADGCDNHCTYCLIPSIRGKYFSIPVEQLIKEAESLGEIKELILVAQDVTKYGVDLYGKKSLSLLIERLSALDNINSIRLLYCYPENIDNELIDQLIHNDKLIKYLDIPFQHGSDTVLKRMNRKGSFDGYLALVNDLKEKVKGIALRSTFIAGFSGESEEDFGKLKDFLLKARLFNAGFFAYSKEEGTPAYKLDGEVCESVKNKRVKELYALQKKISRENLARYKGEVIEVLCDGIDYDRQCFVGRAYFQAPDIDGVVYFKSGSGEVIEQGEYYKVRITRSSSYDLFGRTL